MIKAYLAQYEVYLWAAAVIVILIGGVALVHHLENIGVQRQQVADAKLAQAQIVHTAEVEAAAEKLVAASGSQLHAALVAPAPVGGVAVRVCPSAPSKLKLPADAGSVAGVGSGPAAVSGSVGVGSDSAGLDIAPETRRLLARCDAEITYWRQYYATCKKQGICK